MVFALTEKLEGEILEALENQEQEFLVDAENAVLVSKDKVRADEDSFYTLPEWTSSEGFKLREDFVSTLHSPIAKDELQRILHSGRGVFRSFKNELKNYPEVEKLWHQFKFRKMHEYINDWYNQLREIWGLEKLEQEPEETDDLVKDDFTFESYESSDQKSFATSETILQILKNAALGEFEGSAPDELREVFFDLWQQKFEKADSAGQTGIVCRSNSDEFAGIITAAPASKRTENIMVLTGFYVPEKFRGLGIGSELLSMFMDALKDQKKQWILLTDVIVPENLESLLNRSGFEKTGSGYAAKIQ